MPVFHINMDMPACLQQGKQPSIYNIIRTIPHKLRAISKSSLPADAVKDAL